MNDARRTTPVAFLRPLRSQRPTAAPRPLVGPIAVKCGGVSLELRSGSLLVGRLTECDLVLDDPLVSRMHARLALTPDAVTLEDLHSANGVYVNGERLVQVVALNVGDCVVIGGQELELTELRTDPAPSPPAVADENEEESPLPPSTPKTLRTALPANAIPITARAEALDMLGTLARRLANEHKAEQAPRMLGPHLRGILRGASSGLVVPEALSDLASEYALDLAHWTADPLWLDYVIELHLVTGRLVNAPLLAGLQRAERWVGPMNRARLEYYVATFAGSKKLDPDAKQRLALLRRLLKKK